MAHLLFGSPPRSKQVGAGLILAEKPEGLVVTGVLPSGAAGRDGRLAIGDLLTHIDGQEARSLKSAKVLMMGEPGTYVEVTIVREGRGLHFSIWRPDGTVTPVPSESGAATPARKALTPGEHMSPGGDAAAAAAKTKRIESETTALVAALRAGQPLSAKKAEHTGAPALAAPVPDAAARREGEGQARDQPLTPERARLSDKANDVLVLAQRRQLEAQKAAAIASTALASSASAHQRAGAATHDTVSYYLDSPSFASPAAPMKHQSDREIIAAAHPHVCKALSNELRRIRVRGGMFSKLTSEAALRLGQCQHVLKLLRDQTQLSNSDILVELRSSRLQVLTAQTCEVTIAHACSLIHSHTPYPPPHD
jgi:hypothetical protein